MQPVLIDGTWREADAEGSFRAWDPKLAKAIEVDYPISSWNDCDAALSAAAEAFDQMRNMPRSALAEFLNRFADLIESHADAITAMAAQETALPIQPRLAGAELPRTTDQLRQAAAAATTGDWTHPVIDTARNIRSCLGPIGPVAVFGPNNFPLAFNSVSGGDFAAAIAAGCPVIAKANSMHPGTTRLLAEQAAVAVRDCGLPRGVVQLLYRTSHENGYRMVADPRLGAVGYTGARHAGLKLKAAADAVGKPIYLELSSINPCVILPGALTERGDSIVDEFCTSCLMGTGQFCTNPGLVLLLRGPQSESFVEQVAARFDAAPVGTLLSESGQRALHDAIKALVAAGAELATGGEIGGGEGFSHRNTLLKTTGERFLSDPATFQTEAFGNASLFVMVDSVEQLQRILRTLEGNLTGTIYSDTKGGDDDIHAAIEPLLRQKVGRLINDRMPTGVAVSPAMNHGGPYPATGHPGFTAVGIPASLRRFGMLQCYDQVRHERLPDVLRDDNPTGAWRCVDGGWTREPIGQPVSA